MIAYTGPARILINNSDYVKGQLKKLEIKLEMCNTKSEKRKIEKDIAIYEKAHREHTEIRNSKTEWDNI
jgi:hypothetical protein